LAGFTEKKIAIAKRDFATYARDLLYSKFHNFDNNLKIFLHFCETNEVAKNITGPLKVNPNVDLKDWWTKFKATGGSFVGSKHYTLPLDETDRTALLYQFLLALDAGVYDFMDFCMGAYGRTRYDDNVFAFNDDISKKVVKSLQNKLEDVEPDEEKQNESTSGIEKDNFDWDLFFLMLPKTRRQLLGL
jgi:hypothetical protein